MMAPSAGPASVRHFTAAGNTLPGGFSFGGSMGPVAEEQDEKDEEHVLGRNTLKLKSQAIVRNHTESQPTAQGKPSWELTDDLMQQPWGTVLRVLQPSNQYQSNKGHARPTPKLYSHTPV